MPRREVVPVVPEVVPERPEIPVRFSKKNGFLERLRVGTTNEVLERVPGTTSPRPGESDEERGEYRVVSFSMYEQDIADLRAKVAKLRERGLSWMSMSALVRIALRRFDIDHLAPPTKRETALEARVAVLERELAAARTKPP